MTTMTTGNVQNRPSLLPHLTAVLVLLRAVILSSTPAAAVGPVRVNFGVLMPAKSVSPVMQDPCARLEWTRAEQSFVADEIRRRFGETWVVGDETTRSGSTARVDVRLTMTYTDTQCSDTYGPYAAMQVHAVP